MTKDDFLKQKKEFEDNSIIAFEELMQIAKEEDDPMSRIVICSFYGIIVCMKQFTKPEGNTVLSLLTALQNGMYQMANKLNNQIEEYKKIFSKKLKGMERQ